MMLIISMTSDIQEVINYSVASFLMSHGNKVNSFLTHSL